MIEIGIDKESVSIFFCNLSCFADTLQRVVVGKKAIRIHFFATDRVAIDIDFAFICKTY